MVHASRILTRKYHLVITNPPYLGAGQHGTVLKDFCEEHYKAAKSDLANVFLERSLKLCKPGGAVSFVMPQNWLFLKSYQKQREHLLRYATWNLLARLGAGAFETITGEVVNAILLTLTHARPSEDQMLRGLDASAEKMPTGKATVLCQADFITIPQESQLRNPDARITFEAASEIALLSQIAEGVHGFGSKDSPRFFRQFWELHCFKQDWQLMQTTVESTTLWGGYEQAVYWQKGAGILAELGRTGLAIPAGKSAWGKWGVAISQMRTLPSALHVGEIFDKNVAVVLPNNPIHLAAIWCYCSSPQYNEAVRKIDQKVNVTNTTLVKVPFDLAHWQKVAAERYPNGLPKPYSDEPTQWIFHGHPKPATDPLQVAVARLLGYRWPAESDAEMELSDEARAWIARLANLDGLIDDDGIVCLPAVRGEQSAETRLRALLAKAFGSDWSAARESQLLRDAGCDGLPLAQWLRDKFFEQHVTRFQKRPFIWHVWDGHKEGFSALVNYHLLTREKLNTLINLYLGDWITQQKRAIAAADKEKASDATLKLAKAEALKAQLEAILEGEPPHDIFVRWKPLHQQPLGWDPDINDGVRMNIRPFVEAGVLRIPRNKLGIKWEADRGKDVASAPWYKLGPTYDEPEGTRINDHHTTLAQKRVARAEYQGETPC